MTVPMKKRMAGIVILVICFFLLFYMGMSIGGRHETASAEVKENTRIIAVVNMDQGIRLDRGITNYGTQMLNLTNEHYYSTSLEDARSGIETGKFAAYIIVPPDFSEKVWSINTTPEKSTLEYAINPNLQDSITLDVLYDVKGFEKTLNTNISYLYLYSILQEFHSGQTSAEAIMKNDKKDWENLNAIHSDELLQPLVFVELQPFEEYPDDVDLIARYQSIDKAMEELGSQYDAYISWAETDLDDILKKGKIVTEAMEGFHVAISDISLLEDNDGKPIYKEGKEAFFNELVQYNTELAEERALLKEKFQWLAHQGSIATASDATPSEAAENTWLEQIQAVHERQREEYNQRLESWKESFDYTMLATPSQATPSQATPSQATPSQATPSQATPSQAIPLLPEIPELNHDWLLERDYNMVSIAMDRVYERLEDELEGSDLDEDQVDEVKWLIWQTYKDEELIRPVVASASNAFPVTGSPEAGLYIKDFLDSMPYYEGGLTNELDIISDETADFCAGQIEFLKMRSLIPLNGLKQLYEAVFIKKLETQESYLQKILGKNLDELGEKFNDFSRELRTYQPLHSRNEDDLNHIKSNLQESMFGIQNEVNEKTGVDREYMSILRENQGKDIASLKEELDLSYEGTAAKLEDALNHAKDNRKQLNQENEKLLSDFTRKLPYTRNGSVAATNTYDVIADPVVFREKAVKKKILVINGKEVHIGEEWIWGLLAAIIALLSIQIIHLSIKIKRLKEERER